MKKSSFLPARRTFLQIAAGTALAPFVPLRYAVGDDGVREYRIDAASSPVRLRDAPFPETELWCFNGQTPGPAIRMRQGERVRIVVANQLKEDTGIHWHGVRVPNEMDGVPFLTQPPIETGEEFVYEFAPPDAGTFWYHSHQNAAIQQGRGLHGPFIVEEPEPVQVDRELIWVLDDWRLDEKAQISDDFYDVRDYSRGGRIGNTVTLNGRISPEIRVRAGERIRLRVINSANARIFGFRIQGHHPKIIALDGQPVAPFEPPGNEVVLAPAQRADLVLDLEGKPGDQYSLVDTFYPQSSYRLALLTYADAPPLRESPSDTPISLSDNPITEPVLDGAFQKEILLEGGDLGRMRQAYVENKQRGLSEMLLVGKFWAICGVAAFRQVMPPLFTVKRGQTCILDLKNHSVWPHTMHAHGHSFRILEHRGLTIQERKLQDTVWLGPEEEAKVAFVADNPGDWLFHCHMLSHAEAGMLATFRVT